MLPLPPGYRPEDTLAFHGRDPASPAERVEGNGLRKVVAWRGEPHALSITLKADSAEIDSELPENVAGAVASRLLGLRCAVESFESQFGQHPLLGPLITARPGLRIHEQASFFEALTWAIMGQQVNLSFALSLRRRWIELAGMRHSGGLWSYPEPEAVALLEPEALRPLQFSGAKSTTLISLARDVAAGKLSLEGDPDELAERLLQRKGIGPWTVQYAMMRGAARADCSLHGDAAVRRALQRLLGRPLTPADAEAWLMDCRPHRSLAAAHLWASLRDS